MNFQKYDDIFNKNNYPIFNHNNENIDIDDDGACLCLSGQKYKDCCKKEIECALQRANTESDIEELRKIYYQKDKKMLSRKINHKAVQKKRISYCSAEKVFGNCNQNNNVHSHTMSKSKVLKELSGNDKGVIAFNDHTVQDPNNILNNINSYYEDLEIKEASVTVSFCKTHDDQLFMDIENGSSYDNTDIQNLEYALKAITFDLYYKIQNIQYLASLVKTTKKVFSLYNGQKSNLIEHYYNFVHELFELYPIMITILEELKDLKEKGNKPKLETICFDLPCKKVNFSCCEVIPKNNTYYFVNVINGPNPVMIYSYYNDKTSGWLHKMKKEFDSASNKRNYLYDFILSEIITNAQNIFFNKVAFQNLSDDLKIYLYVIHREGTFNIPDDKHMLYYKNMIGFLFD